MTRLSAEEMIAFAMSIDPDIFENKSPVTHKRILEFIDTNERRKLVEMFRGGAKSTLINNIFVTKKVYFDNEPFTWVVSETGTQAKSFLRKIKRSATKLASSGWDIRRGEIFNENESEFITNGKVCGVACFGAGENPRGITSSEGGKRPTLIVIDDILSREKAKKKEQREKIKDWFYSDIEPALHPNGTIVAIGTPLHEEDLLNEFLKSGDWKCLVVPIIINGKSAWNSRYSLEWIDKRKQNLFKKGMSKTWYNEYLCVPQGDEDMLFKPELLQYFKGLKYELSEEYITLENAKEKKKVLVRNPTHIILENDTLIPLDECVRYTTMDLSTSTGKDKTAIITCAYDTNRNMYVLDINSGFYTPFEKSLQALKVYKEFKPFAFGIEKAGAQNDFFYTIDEAQKQTGIYVPVRELSHGGVNKNIRISNLHPLFAAQKVFLNKSDINTNFLEAELSAFQIDIEGSRDDHIDALAYQLQFIKNRSFSNASNNSRRRNIIVS